jgi:hypothetical protein
MKPDGSGERILTAGFHNEGPTFAPNGRVVMFFRDPGGNSGPSLFTVDISGRNEQRVPTPGFASDPAWSPLLSWTCARDQAAPHGCRANRSANTAYSAELSGGFSSLQPETTFR